jgi:hypothetical protein
MNKGVDVFTVRSHRCGGHPALSCFILLDSLLGRPPEPQFLAFGCHFPNRFRIIIDGHFGLVYQHERDLGHSIVSYVELIIVHKESDTTKIEDIT